MVSLTIVAFQCAREAKLDYIVIKWEPKFYLLVVYLSFRIELPPGKLLVHSYCSESYSFHGWL